VIFAVSRFFFGCAFPSLKEEDFCFVVDPSGCFFYLSATSCETKRLVSGRGTAEAVSCFPRRAPFFFFYFGSAATLFFLQLTRKRVSIR